MEFLPSILKLLVIFSAFVGFVIAFNIHSKKKSKRPMVCPLNGKCDTVVNSKYAQFLGVDLAVGGMGYYALIALVYGGLLVFGEAVPEVVTFLVLGLSLGAFLFSAYLTGIQAFVLKSWCTWCLCSAAISTLIAIFSLLGLQVDILPILAEYKWLIVIVHALAAAIGVGATTVTDISFTKFLKDFRVDQAESKTMRMYSQIIWVALGVLILTGVGLYLPEAARLNESSKFLVKVIVVAVITLNGLALNFFVTPRLTKVKFEAKPGDISPRARFVRQLIYASGSVSIISWYVVFILGSVSSVPLPFMNVLLIYLGLLLFGLVGSQLYERIIIRKATKNLAEE